jgi:hypothetical protein
MYAQSQVATPRSRVQSQFAVRADALALAYVGERPATISDIPEKAVARRARCTWVAPAALVASAEWCRLRARAAGARSFIQPQIGAGPDLTAIPINDPPAMWGLLNEAGYTPKARKQIIDAITTLCKADAVIVRPSDGGGADTGEYSAFAHVADLARDAYRALQPPRWLVAHPGFAQVARQFDYVQLGRGQARLLGAGSIDIGVLAERLRQAQGKLGECAVIDDAREGCLWAEARWWTIPALNPESVSNRAPGDLFCTGWTLARRFYGLKAAQALCFAHNFATAAR